ncbi:transglutaminase family protein [Salipiger bermudensis]|uniref:transglutaminase family protein n=1 Tax=Salipiger bermudensis TaxID=344736 RepID=UPI001A8D753A|nr:transglutaminase family protein [Salipiger bermudensis]MBN9674433.1 transglutaminase family protein [Salipiger bermudensis]
MRFSVRHETIYSYDTPVVLAAHRLRLTPRGDCGRVLSRGLEILPEPAMMREEVDAHGNPLVLVEFGPGASDLLRIDSAFEIETRQATPPGAQRLPRLPWPRLDDAPDACLTGRDPGPEVRRFAEGLAELAGRDAMGFLELLTATLYQRTDRRIRQDGYAQSPQETLERAQGACRDLAVLFIACCRLMGLPARFVSGYQAQAESVDGQRHLHAWPEVWLGQAGWQGFDPTHGTRVRDGHVALCAAPEQGETMPVEGGYYGPPVAARLRYRVEVEVRA